MDAVLESLGVAAVTVAAEQVREWCTQLSRDEHFELMQTLCARYPLVAEDVDADGQASMTKPNGQASKRPRAAAEVES
jgi:hypothetical protein